MVAWKANATLDGVLAEATWKADTSFRDKMAVRVCLIRPLKRRQLEAAMTEAVIEAGIIPPQGELIVEGIYVGSWQDLFSWILENMPKILEMIMSILVLF